MRPIKFFIETYPELSSTNSTLLEQRNDSDFHGKILRAVVQNAGVGRRGKIWHAGEANLTCSIGIHFVADEKEYIPWLGIWLSTIIYDVAKQFIPEKKLTLKWPNDLYADGKKLAGILIQARQQGDDHYLALGLGMNINVAPLISDSSVSAIALSAFTEQMIDVENFLISLQNACQQAWPILFDRSLLRTEWEARAKFLGNEITIIDSIARPAQALGLNQEARLVVRYADGVVIPLNSEEISLRF